MAELTAEVAVALLTGPIGGADAIAVRRLRQLLRAGELAAGGGRASDDLLVELLRDGSCGADGPVAVDRAGRAGGGGARAGRAAQAESGASAETVLWAIWQATGLGPLWRRAALSGGGSGERADRDLDAVVALFEAAAAFVDRLPGVRLRPRSWSTWRVRSCPPTPSPSGPRPGTRSPW